MLLLASAVAMETEGCVPSPLQLPLQPTPPTVLHCLKTGIPLESADDKAFS